MISTIYMESSPQVSFISSGTELGDGIYRNIFSMLFHSYGLVFPHVYTRKDLLLEGIVLTEDILKDDGTSPRSWK